MESLGNLAAYLLSKNNAVVSFLCKTSNNCVALKQASFTRIQRQSMSPGRCRIVVFDKVVLHPLSLNPQPQSNDLESE